MTCRLLSTHMESPCVHFIPHRYMHEYMSAERVRPNGRNCRDGPHKAQMSFLNLSWASRTDWTISSWSSTHSEELQNHVKGHPEVVLRLSQIMLEHVLESTHRAVLEKKSLSLVRALAQVMPFLMSVDEDCLTQIFIRYTSSPGNLESDKAEIALDDCTVWSLGLKEIIGGCKQSKACLTGLSTAVDKRLVCGSTTTSVVKKRCCIYSCTVVLRYRFYGTHPYRTWAVQGPDGMGTVPYPPYVVGIPIAKGYSHSEEPFLRFLPVLQKQGNLKLTLTKWLWLILSVLLHCALGQPVHCMLSYSYSLLWLVRCDARMTMKRRRNHQSGHNGGEKEEVDAAKLLFLELCEGCSCCSECLCISESSCPSREMNIELVKGSSFPDPIQ